MKTIIFFCMIFLVTIILLANSKTHNNKLPVENAIGKEIITGDTPIVYLPEIVIYGNKH